MMKFLLNLLKTIILLSVLVVALSALGKTINDVIPWGVLTTIFGIIHHLLSIFAWIWDIDSLWTFLGIGITVYVAYWSMRGVLWGIRWWQGVN